MQPPLFLAQMLVNRVEKGDQIVARALLLFAFRFFAGRLPFQLDGAPRIDARMGRKATAASFGTTPSSAHASAICNSTSSQVS